VAEWLRNGLQSRAPLALWHRRNPRHDRLKTGLIELFGPPDEEDTTA
jgi:hypothetical protein